MGYASSFVLQQMEGLICLRNECAHALLVHSMQADSIVEQPFASVWKPTIRCPMQRGPVGRIADICLSAKLPECLHDVCVALQERANT